MSRNFLDAETSPYLLQHKDNPVHWRPWGPEALAQAAAENRPIMLSVGYAACHWCHVMAHESFEDEATAALINDWFIPVKVDREERPDIDTIYQTALSLLGQSGGRPLTMFLTPDGKPFWGGTYFPPDARYGRPAFRDILARLHEVWEGQPDQIASNVRAMTTALDRQLAQPKAGGGSLTGAVFDLAAQALLRMIDNSEGGTQGAPKFPQTSLLGVLWRAWGRTGDDNYKAAVLVSLDHMCQGGIYDHVGGGFARYSTDAHWLVPHFEKMLYDNALLVELLTQAWRATGSPLYARRVAETVGWLEREMIAEHGAFAASLDADSEGGEGAFYVWSLEEIQRLLPADAATVFCRVYDVTAAGNWEDHNILHRNHEQGGFDPAMEAALAVSRETLLAAREPRPRPGRDDKILADWNGMMIAALAQAGFAFSRPEWLALANRAFAAVTGEMEKDGRLAHSLRRGRRQPEAMLDDYAQMARAALMLHEVTGEADYLGRAEGWVAVAETHYRDVASGAYFLTADDAPGLILRTVTATDHASPSGNATMVDVLARLHHITGKPEYRDRAEAVAGAFAADIARAYPSQCALLTGWELIEGAIRVAVLGAPDDPARARLLAAVAETMPSHAVLVQPAPGQALPAGFPSDMPITGAAVMICEGETCSLPITDPELLRRALRGEMEEEGAEE